MNKTLQLLDDYLNGKNRNSFDSMSQKRRIIIWYDKNKDYKELVESIINGSYTDELSDKIKNAKFYIYENNSIEIRYNIEILDETNDIVIYLPFDRPSAKDNNYLLDIESFNYDYIFIPDNTTIKLNEYNLSIDCKNVLEEYKLFFRDKKREAKFKDRINSDMNPQDVERVIISIILGIDNTTDDAILKSYIKSYYEDRKTYYDMMKFAKQFVFKLFEDYLYVKLNDNTDIENEFYRILFTHFVKDLKITDSIRKVIDRYGVFYNQESSTNSYILANSLMKDIETTEVFNKISDDSYAKIGISDIIDNIDVESLYNVDTYREVDRKIISDIVKRILDNSYKYDEFIDLINGRKKKYWYKTSFEYDYMVLEYSLYFFNKITTINDVKNIKTIEEFVKLYEDKYQEIDYIYRKISIALMHVENGDIYKDLIESVNNKYDMDFVQEIQEKWYKLISEKNDYNINTIEKQQDFYKNNIEPFEDKKERVFVIISDALRYECGKELYLEINKFASNAEMRSALCTVPSYTKLGMAALLPHNKLALEKDDVLIDNNKTSTVLDRDKVLKNKFPESLAIKYEDLMNKTKNDWKKDLSGYKIIYIYHNVIDKIGEHDENRVFEACDKCIKELKKLIIDLHTTFSSVTLFVTSDHGFFYQNKKVESHMKTEKISDGVLVKDRYTYTTDKVQEPGILSIDMSYITDTKNKYVNIPKSYNQFYKQGNYNSYIHGGALPEELILPLIYVKTKREDSKGNNRLGKKVSITYSGLSRKITNAITYLDFVQDNSVSDELRECRYILHFEDEDGNRISDETTIVANLSSKDIKDRYFKEKFVFKNISYNKDAKYKLVIIDEETNVVVKEIEFVIDIVIVNNFDF
ncbi:MAG: BREX-1 system phosphatase PglZ type A [Lachnospiraceae bacterium]|nr:BREX-1 system phosphatase PglZ type A [Lachnospiraceae bacterium]